jgi:DNA-binding IclR family transcriptional regulator
MTTRTEYHAPAAACAAEVLLTLARSTSAQSASDLARATTRSKSLVFRVLHELENRGLVERNETNRFRLGVSTLELGGAYLTSSDLGTSTRTVLRGLAQRLGVTINMAVLENDQALYIMREEAPNEILTMTHIGSRLPAGCCATGRALLAELDDDEVSRIMPAELPMITSRSIRTRTDLLLELAAIREQGYATEDGEIVPGRRCVAIAVRLASFTDRSVALGVSMSSEVLVEQDAETVAALRETALKLDAGAKARAAFDDRPGVNQPAVVLDRISI